LKKNIKILLAKDFVSGDFDNFFLDTLAEILGNTNFAKVKQYKCVHGTHLLHCQKRIGTVRRPSRETVTTSFLMRLLHNATKGSVLIGWGSALSRGGRRKKQNAILLFLYAWASCSMNEEPFVAHVMQKRTREVSEGDTSRVL